MDPINIPERLDPSSRIGDAQPDRSEHKREGRRKKVKPQTPPTADTPPDPDDGSHQLDELA
jgi:hypothetical protein